MIQMLRSLISSKFGIGVAIAFLGIIALGFAAQDVNNVTSGAASGASGDKVASVGKQQIQASQLSQAASNALENLKQNNPRMSMQAFVANDGLEKALDELIDNVALAVFGRENGIVASDRLIDSEIAKVAAFKGADGKFSDAAFQQMLQQRGMTEQRLRDDLAQSLIARQLVIPAGYGAVLSRDTTVRYTALLRERRSGAVGLLPAEAFAPKTPPTDAELQSFYAKNSERFILPERRVLRYAAFNDGVLKQVPAPTEAEISARYAAGKALYSAQESRRITQLIAPTEPAAKAIAAEIAGGKRFEAVAAGKGLAAASIGTLTKDALARQSSAAVADAAFAAASGSIAAPARSALGWHILRIDGIERRAERSLDSVRGELTAALVAEKRRAAINDLSARLEEEFSDGGNLADAAKELGLTLQDTPPLTADGQVYGQPGKTAPPLLAKLMQTAFAMEREGQPQLAEVDPGKAFVIFDVTAITPSAAAPLADIRSDVAASLALERGAAAAKTAAEKVLAEARKGTDIGAALQSLGTPLPSVQRVNMGREELAASQGRVPPPLMLMFSMARGTTKLLPAPNNRGWFIVSLKEIVPGQVDGKDPMIEAAQRELSQLAGQEYGHQLVRAIRKELGVKREDGALRALRTQLTGGN